MTIRRLLGSQMRILKTYSTAASLKSFNSIPGPKSYPLVGNLFELKQFGGELEFISLIEFLKKLNRKYGDVVNWSLFNRTQIFLFNPDLVKQIHQIDGISPTRKPTRPWVFYYKKRGLAIPLFSSTGERWRKLRTAANPLAARPQTIYSYIEKHANVVNEFVQVLDDMFKSTNDNTILCNNFEKHIHALALEMISVITLDRRILCVNEKYREPTAIDLIKYMEIFMKLTGKLNVSLPLWMYFETKDRKMFFEAFDYIYKVNNTHIKEAAVRLMASKDILESDKEKTILQQLIMNKDKYKLDMDDINSIMIDLLMAGFDTTSNALHYMVYELGRNEDIQEKLHNEISTFVNDDKENEITEDKLAKMRYLKSIVKESLRLHTLLPVYGRVLQQDLVLSGYNLPKGTSVSICVATMSTSEKYFKNPLKFNPERWLNENEQIHPYASLPFGYGPRMCIGRRVSEQEIYIILIKLIQNYKIEYVGEDIEYKFGTLMYPNKPLNIKLTKRKHI